MRAVQTVKALRFTGEDSSKKQIYFYYDEAKLYGDLNKMRKSITYHVKYDDSTESAIGVFQQLSLRAMYSRFNLFTVLDYIVAWHQMVSIMTFAIAIADVRILKQYGEHQNGSSIFSDMVIIFACSMVVTVAIVGSVGTVKNNIKILYLYIGLLMTLAFFELLIVIFVIVQRYGLQIRVSEWIRNDFFANTTEENVGTHQHLWDHMQTHYSCCGLNGPDDYAAIRQPISMSCCKRAYLARTSQAQKAMYQSCLVSETYYDVGCEDAILKMLESEADYLLGVAVFTMWLEAVSMMLAVCVSNQLKNAVHVYKEAVKY